MGFPLDLALRYMSSKKRAFISVGTLFAILGVALGVAALATVMSVTGGFRAQFREKVLGVNAHVLILKRSSNFSEYRELMKQMEDEPGVIGIAPFAINPMMVTHEDRTATGVLLKGVDPDRVGDVLDLPKHIIEGSLDGLRLPGAKPPESRREIFRKTTKPTTPPGPLSGEDFHDELERIIREESENVRDEEERDEPELSDLPAEGAAGASNIAPGVAPDAPAGSIVPEGGFDSELPDDDILPDEINPDPCTTADATLPGIVVGKALAETLDAKLGDCLRVTSPTIGFSFSQDTIRAPVAKLFRMIAIFEAGFEQYDARLVYTDLYEAQAFYDTGDTVTGIEMKVDDIENAKAIAQDIEDRLHSGLLYTMDWEELNHGLFTALRIQQILMSMVLALIIVVAAFTVIATLIMVVLDKKKEIAVLKAMGASDGAVLRVFLYQGGIVGFLGAAIGLVLGIATCKGLLVYAVPLDPKVYFISHLPVQVKPVEFALVGVFAIVVCLVATVWPAMYAAKLRPAEAFREQ